MRIVNGPIKPGLIDELITSNSDNHESGACSIFLGQVRRDLSGGKFVRAVEYSAYEELVVMEANKINKTILSEFEDVKTFEIIHSKGLVKAGEISLLIMVSAGHREHAINACSKAVELIREKLPVVKKELFEDDSEDGNQNE
jgi:molybdopterin synthase catalytic subunit